MGLAKTLPFEVRAKMALTVHLHVCLAEMDDDEELDDDDLEECLEDDSEVVDMLLEMLDKQGVIYHPLLIPMTNETTSNRH